MTESARDSVYINLLQLEKEARHAENSKVLTYIMVNRGRSLVTYRQAVLFRLPSKNDAQVTAISDVPTVDRNAPFVRWLKRVACNIAATETGQQLHEIDTSLWSDKDREALSQWLPACLLWCPLKTPDDTLLGALLVARDGAWNEQDTTLLSHLTDAWGHAWGATLGPGRRHKRRSLGWLLKAMAAILVAVQFIPVSQTALAPAEVVAYKPELVAAPMDGVIKTVHVAPNGTVAKGDPLFSFDATGLTGRLDVAEEELLVARTALRTARQGAFNDPRHNAEVALLQTRVSLREAERDHIRAQVARKDVYARRSGVAVFRSASDLEGRPVIVGERIMLIAEPLDTELRIELAIADAVVMEPGSPVRLFLDRDPLAPVDAVLEHIAYEADTSPSGTLSYRLIARFVDTEPPRIGLRGTAKIQGERVPLFMYLFRRPLSVLRQWLGL